jgi:hypothetical protein
MSSAWQRFRKRRNVAVKLMAGGAHAPKVLVGVYATQGPSNVRPPKLKHYYGLNHLHCLTASTYPWARLLDSESFRKQRVATFGELERGLRFRGWRIYVGFYVCA